MSETRRRRDALIDLIELRSSLDAAIAAVRGLPWDSDVDLVFLTRANVDVLLQRYLRGELSAADLERWADAVESREDIGSEHGYEELLRAFVFETANPVLAEPISDGFARRWLERLGGG
jgi:hypothetical protein